jgi:hypothetical protein
MKIAGWLDSLTRPLRLVKAPAAGHPLPQGGEGSDFRGSAARNLALVRAPGVDKQSEIPRFARNDTAAEVLAQHVKGPQVFSQAKAIGNSGRIHKKDSERDSSLRSV